MPDLSVILGGIVGAILLIGSLLFKNERQARKTAEKERDDAQAEAIDANQRLESAGTIAKINREKEKKDDEIINSPVYRDRPLGVWHYSDSDS